MSEARVRHDTRPGGPLGGARVEAVMRRELLGLPALQREALLLRIRERKSYREISDLTGLEPAGVTSLVRQGLLDLTRRLKEAGVI